MSKRARVIVDKDYFELLVDKAEMFDDIFEIFESLEDARKIHARSHKVPPEVEGSEPYEEKGR
jgi:hypothetical protein